ncbi:MAG: hypothetical protein ABIO05_08070 [Ferruginibacter sp.]
MKILLALMVTFIFSTGNAQLRSNKDLIGKWKSNQTLLTFFPDGRVELLLNGGILPGARYKTDFVSFPPLLTINVEQNHQSIIYRSSLQFIDSKTLKITTLSDDLSKAFTAQRSITFYKD